MDCSNRCRISVFEFGGDSVGRIGRIVVFECVFERSISCIWIVGITRV